MARRALWIVLGLVAINLSLFAGCFLSKWIPAGKVIERERTRVNQEIAAIRAERVTRPVLFEPAEEGNSWELLTEGLAPFGNLSGDEKYALPTLREQFYPDSPQEDVTELLKKIEPAFEVLKRALRRPWVEPGYRYEEGFDLGMPHLNSSIQACYMLSDRAWARHEAGNSAEAVDLLITGFGLAERVTVKGLVVCELARIADAEIMFEMFRRMLGNLRLASGDLARMERALALIESSRTETIDAYLREDVVVAAGLLSIVDSGDFGKLPEPGRWREGIRLSSVQRLSIRILAAEYFDIKADFNLRVESAVRSPLKERLIHLGKLDDEEVRQLKNPLEAFMVRRDLWRSWLNQARDVQRMSLARLAVAVARHREETGRFPSALGELVPQYLASIPSDEISGHPFAYSVQGESAKVYSWDRDGDDDGGREPDGGAYDLGRDVADGDVVWTVKRAK